MTTPDTHPQPPTAQAQPADPAVTYESAPTHLVRGEGEEVVAMLRSIADDIEDETL